MPTKHTNFSESLLGFGSYVLSRLQSPESIDDLWKMYENDYKKKYFAKQSFDNLLLTIVFLHLIGAINENDGMIVKCD